MVKSPQMPIESRVEKIRQRLIEALSPEEIEVIDESAKHHGHPGAQAGGGHFLVNISAKAFSGKSLIESHQMVYQALGEMMQHEIHALRIKTKA